MKKIPIWTLSELAKITEAVILPVEKQSLEDVNIFGFSIDSRTISKGDIFVAIKGERDGHDYVMNAFKAGAKVALVSKIPDNYNNKFKLILVKDVLIALNQIAVSAKRRFTGLTIAVTGSVGKTSTKEMLKFALEPFGKVHASSKSFNNYLGVPISLASLPPNSQFAVFEIGMNSPGEIGPLARLVRPDHVVITTTGKSHTENFDDLKEIAKEKASIVKGMRKSGKALLCTDGDLQDDIWKFLKRDAIRVIRFGSTGRPDYKVRYLEQNSNGTVLKLEAPSKGEIYFKFGFLGKHFMSNAVGVISMLVELGLDVSEGILSLSKWVPVNGRGNNYLIDMSNELSEKLVNLIDDSYNSNPISLKASIENLASYENLHFFGGRKIQRFAILGDMLELGEDAASEHEKISNFHCIKRIDKIYCVGTNMKFLYDNLLAQQKGGWFKQTEELIKELRYLVANADIILVKASNGFKFSQVIDKIKSLGKVVPH